MNKIKTLKIAMLAFLVSIVITACSITLPVNATSNSVGSKVGESSGFVLFGFISFDSDASIRTAAINGNITKISTVDFKQEGLPGIFVVITTIVTGE